ncbi:hypothetical protein M501DRAFT_1015949 [Patellaria atrata CBS 101060]|uniref:BTB domain-containing protein n=1 Tax=Patellaria atrata CBS 101060 TaxID=1346257 RepID=A0A9P4VSH4_9PEZI|nr:hypothetical protein M501DRAFT_1015949 [Patellaria atrata CBS 101060]
MVFKKYDIEEALHAEKQDIAAGKLKDDNPLDLSPSFAEFCHACRKGDLKTCQEKITEGVNINARDKFDYTPLILASLCGHYEVVQLLLEAGALCERDTFQGERCLYNALNDRIRNLLLSYDYSKSTDPLQPLAAHITSLLSLEHPKTSDISIVTAHESFNLHKFILSARSPYFAKKLAAAPGINTWRLPNTLPAESFRVAIRHLYLGEVSVDLGDGEEEQEILTGIDRLSRQLETERLFENILEGGDRRLSRQRRTEEVNRGRGQLENWYRTNILKHKVDIDSDKVNSVRWDRKNAIFSDVLLRADEDIVEEDEKKTLATQPVVRNTLGPLNGIPIGPMAKLQTPSRLRKPRKSVLFPVHRAMLLRSEFFLTMFSSGFREAQETDHLQIIPVDCSPEVLEVILNFLYTEKAEFPLDIAIDVLFAADLLFIEKLKQKAAVIISTLGNGSASVVEAENPRGETGIEEIIDIYDVVRAGWDTRVHRLEEFGARYLAYRLERYIDEEEFAKLVRESANRIKHRQETDTVELIDDIRYYLSERFRLRFEDAGLDEMMDEEFNPANPNFATSSSDEPVDISNLKITDDGGVDVLSSLPTTNGQTSRTNGLQITDDFQGVIRTIDGDIVDDEFAEDAMNYRILLGKIEALLENLNLDA